VIGNYKILNVIGEGGFGRTYRAEHTILQKPVVIKQANFQGPAAQAINQNLHRDFRTVNYKDFP